MYVMPYFLKTDWVLLYVIPFSASYFTPLKLFLSKSLLELTLINKFHFNGIKIKLEAIPAGIKNQMKSSSLNLSVDTQS